MGDREQQLDEALEALRERDLDPQSSGGAVALEFLLGPKDSESAQNATPAVPVAAPPTSPSSPVIDGDDPLATLAGWCGVEASRLGDFFELSDGVRVTVPPGRLPRSKAGAQRVLTLLVLAADRIGRGAGQTDWRQVNEVVADYAVLDQNLGHNLVQNSNLIIRSGKRGAYVYRITRPGLERAQELIQALAANEEVLN